MFTIEQIHTTHSKVKSGADFPAYIQDLIHIGVLSYDIFVTDGHATYSGKDGFCISSGKQYAPLKIASEGNEQKLKDALKVHQQGLTDYLTFCKQAAESGVEKWTVDMNNMTCSYYDKQGLLLVIGSIPNIVQN
ncbi:MAG: DUF1398 domain-containing protein [Dysgonamonadaceae bacterium]|jgi:uncharacterized protein YbcV (DUF1398 family)|nr:DUF1398 domain-containing protein [Dysgonamonadaceae bacterium]